MNSKVVVSVKSPESTTAKHDPPIVLHVDDDSDYLQLFSLSFGKHFNVFSADRAEEALEILAGGKIDILVTDYEMPEMNGIELLKIVRERYPDIQVIFHTGQGNENIARDAFTIGAVDYFTKDYIGFAFKEKVLNSIHKAFLAKRANEEKKESQKKYKDLLESLQDLVFTTDEEGKITFANLSFERILGKKAETFEGTTLLEHIIEEDRKHFAESLGKRLKTGESFITFEVRMESESRGKRHIRFNCTPIRDEKNQFRGLTGTGRDITEEVKAEKDRALVSLIMESLNRTSSPLQAINDILHLIKESTGIEAVGIRIKEGEDYPYFVTNGFPHHFVEKEKYLCARNDKGEIIRDENNTPLLDCMCGNIIRARTNPELPFFTPGGSFWTNSTTNLLGSTTEEDRNGRTRNHCNGEGYESVALIPLKYNNEIIGLLQLNDRRENCFTIEMIEFFEGIGASVGIAIHKIKLQRAIEESEAKFRSFFENSPAGMVIFSADETPKYQEISQSLADRNYLSIEEHIGKTVKEIFGDEKISEEHDSIFREIRESGKPVTVESSGRTLDGKMGHYLAHYFPIKNNSDKANAIGGVIINLNEKVWAEMELKVSREKYRSLVENLNEGVWQIDREGCTTFVNARMAELLGYTVDEMLGKNLREYMDPEKIEEAEYYIERRMKGIKEDHEFLFRKKDGGEIFVRISTTPLFDEAGNYTGALAGIMDVTHRRQADMKLKESEEKYRNLVELLPNTIAEFDHQGNITYMNRTGFQMFGYDKEDLEKGINLSHIAYPEDLKRAWKQAPDLLNGKKSNGNEYKLRRKDGSEFYAKGFTTPVIKNGEHTGWLSTLLDVSDYKELEEKLIKGRERFFQLLETIPAFVSLQEADRKFQYVNRQFIRLFGEPGDNACYEILRKKNTPCEVCPTMEVLKDKKTREWEWKDENSGRTFLIIDSFLEGVDGEQLVLEFGLDITDRIELEQKYRNITESSLQGIGIIQDGRLVFANKALLDASGFTMDDLQISGDESIPPIIFHIHPDDQKRISEVTERLLKENSTPEYNQFRIYTKEGGVLWVESLAQRMEYEGKPAIQFSQVDITARKIAEDTLKKSEEKFRKYFELGLVGMSQGTIDGILLDVNDSFCKMLGCSKEEIVGRTFLELTHPDDRGANSEIFADMLQGKRNNFTIEKRYIRKDGSPVTCLTASSCARNEKGEVEQLYAIIMDISQLKAAHEALIESRKKYKTLTENINEVVYYLDREGDVLYVSPRVEYFGYKVEEVAGNHFLNFIHEDDYERLKEHFHSLMDGNDECFPPFRLKGKNNEYYWLENMANPLRDEKGNIIGLTGILKDISDIVRQQEHIEHLNKVLKAIRKVSQLIVKENDTQKLIGEVCELLTETRGYEAAGIILLDESGKPEGYAESGYGEYLSEFCRKFKEGIIPVCIEKVYEDEPLYVCRDFNNTECDLRLFGLRNLCLVKLLKYGKTAHGIIFISIPEGKEVDDEETELFQELCTDISYSLHQIKMRESRKQILEALKHKNRAEENIQIAGIFIMALDHNGKIVMINRKGAEILGMDEKTLIGKNWIEGFIPEEYQDKCKKHFSRFISGKLGTDLHFEDLIINSSGEKRILLQHSTLMKDEKGKTIGVLCTADDITERKELEEKLKTSLKEKEILLMEINHRTKNNLQILSSLVNHQILKADNNNTKELLSQIKGRLRAMAVIYEALCRQEDIGRVNFQEFLEKLFQDIMTSHRSGKGNIRIEIDAEKIYFDIKKGVACALIVNELVSNSIKHAFPHNELGLVKIKIHADRENYSVNIFDNGVGIPENMNIEKSDSLGLKIVYLLTQQLKGRITHINYEGTVWKISFPV